MVASNLGTALLLVFVLLRRIRHAGQIADAWAQGQLKIRINDKRHDEFGRLAQRFGYMADALDNVIMTKQAVAAQEERNRLARELHDSAKQRCFALGLQVSLLKRLCNSNPEQGGLAASSLKLVDHLQQDMRNVIQRLSAPTVVELGLTEALRQNLEGLLTGSQITWLVAIPVEDAARLSQDEALASELLLIASEAATNTLRHAQATHLTVSLTEHSNRYLWKIEDDGHGFPKPQVDQGMGLANMRQRASMLPQGMISIVSMPGQGTRIEVSFERIKVQP